MHAYLMTGLTRCGQLGMSRTRRGNVEEYQTWVGTDTLIGFGETPEQAQKKFEAYLCRQVEGEPPRETEIIKVVTAPVIPELFTETGPVPFDWVAMCKQEQDALIATPEGDMGQGHWVDLPSLQWPEPLRATIDDLQRELPEDISSGLNWSPERQYLYVLSLMTPPPEFSGETMDVPESDSVSYEDAKASAAEEREWFEKYPEAADKQAAAIIRARNSVVAAWIWRRHVAGQQLAELPIRIEPWRGLMEDPPAG